MELIFNFLALEEMLQSAAGQMNAELEKDCNELSIEIPKEYGQGWLRAINFQNGLSLLFIECKLKEEFSLIGEANDYQPLKFTFCNTGEIRHTIEETNGFDYTLNSLQSSIATCAKDCRQKLILPKGKKISLNRLEINRDVYLKKIKCDLKSIPKPLAQIFRDCTCEQSFLHRSNYQFSIAETINKINTSQYEGMTRKIYLESKVLELMALQLNRYIEEFNSNGKQVPLRKRDIFLIQKAKEILVKDLQKPPTIKMLAKEVGINEFKLKNGFKLIYDNTIYKYLTEHRMEKAKSLLLEENISIENVARKVGYTNHSHFSDRFKEKFGVLPREFVKRIKMEIQ